MQKIYFFFLFSLIYFSGFSQNSELYYAGYFFNKKGKPENMLKVDNISSGISEYTNSKGFLIIKAKENDTLVWNKRLNNLIIKSYNLRELKQALENQIIRKQVEFIQSNDYKELVKDSLQQKDESDVSLKKNNSTKKSNFSRWDISLKKIKNASDSTFYLKRLNSETLVFSLDFTSGAEIKFVNALPKIQSKYVQGRSDGSGNLIWTSPNMNNYFSYGPDISTLGYNGNGNIYDENGDLVLLNNALRPAKAYNNFVINTLFSNQNTIGFGSAYQINNNNVIDFKIKLDEEKEQLYFTDEFSKNSKLNTLLNLNIFGFRANFKYLLSNSKFTNTNNIGFFNRVFQNSLLTPISFNNQQASSLPNQQQRSFHYLFDNPNFLLERKNKYNARVDENTVSIDIEKKFLNDFRIYMLASENQYKQENYNFYRSSTAYFNSGIEDTKQLNFVNKSFLSILTFETGNYEFKNNFDIKYIVNQKRLNIFHSINSKNNDYERTTKEIIFQYKPKLNFDWIRFDFDLNNKTYVSTTTQEKHFWLPHFYTNITFDYLFNSINSLELFSGFSKTVYEADFSKSFSNYYVTSYTANNANSFFPVQELENIIGLKNISKEEFKVGMQYRFSYKFSFSGEYFKNIYKNDVFPVLENGKIYLKNIAQHTLEGFELNFLHKAIRISDNFNMSNMISFYQYKDKVNKTENGYNFHPIIGFKNIYKSIIVGENLGVVVGTYYLRNNNGELIIGADGFPQKVNSQKVIADPTPDFVIKLNNDFDYKNWKLQLDWEWRKGGKIWNGTQSALDYYGRSLNSADNRNIKNYIFSGVTASGNVNNIVVDFYNPYLDVLENRWSRYGVDGVAEAYVEDADFIKLRNISLSGTFKISNNKNLKIGANISNIILWKKYSGVDPEQNFMNLENSQGLDFFNLPGYTGVSFNVSYIY